MTNKNTELTQERLNEVLDYDPDTGVFVWRKTRNSRCVKGCVAGSINRDGYIRISIDYTKHRAHRLAWLYVYGEWPLGIIDHINQNKIDNRIDKLRDVTDQQSQMNSPLQSNNTSGVVGVCWHKKDKKWQAQIKVSRKQINLGQYVDINDAIITRKVAEHAYGFHPNHGKARVEQ